MGTANAILFIVALLRDLAVAEGILAETIRRRDREGKGNYLVLQFRCIVTLDRFFLGGPELHGEAKVKDV